MEKQRERRTGRGSSDPLPGIVKSVYNLSGSG